MATRMQQRRGTALQWTTANPILAAGEIGFESDTNQFKIGDGVNHWEDLSYFKNLEDLGGSLDDYILNTQKGAAGGVAELDSSGKIPVSQLGNIIDGAPDLLNTLNELAAAIGDDANFATSVTDHISDTSAHGVTGNVVGTSDSQTLTNKTISGSSNTLSNIAQTSVTNLTTDLSSLDGRLDTAEGTLSTVSNNVTDLLNGLETANVDIEDLQTSKAPLNSPTFTGTVTLPANTISQSMMGDDSVGTNELGGLSVTTEKLAAGAVTSEKIATGAVTKTMVGLSNVDNTADADKPVSTATQTALDAKLASATAETTYAPIANPTFTGTVSGVTKSMVGLGNVDNTTDANKPVSTATQTALDLKAPKANPTFTGTTTAADVTISGNLTVSGTTTTVDTQDLVVTDPMIYMGEGNSANLVDLGIVTSFNDGTYQHSGIVRDSSDGKWKFFKGVTDEPTTTVNFAQGSLDALAVGALESTSLTVGDVSNTEFGYLNGVTSAIQTQIDAKAPLASPTFTGTVTLPNGAALGTPTSATLTNATGLPLTTGVTGTLPIANGGTGATTASTAAAALLPSQSSNSGKYLTTDGSGTLSWGTVSGYSAPTLGSTSIASGATVSTIAGLTLTSPTVNTPTLTLSTTTSTTEGVIAWDATNDKILIGDGTTAREFASSTLKTNSIATSSYTLVLADKDKMIEIAYDGGASSQLTVPNNSSVNFPIGTQIHMLQTGDARISVNAASGVTIDATPGLYTRTKWSSATLIKRATNTWVLIGDLSA